MSLDSTCLCFAAWCRPPRSTRCSLQWRRFVVVAHHNPMLKLYSSAKTPILLIKRATKSSQAKAKHCPKCFRMWSGFGCDMHTHTRRTPRLASILHLPWIDWRLGSSHVFAGWGYVTCLAGCRSTLMVFKVKKRAAKCSALERVSACACARA